MTNWLTFTQYWKLVDCGLLAFSLPMRCLTLNQGESTCSYYDALEWWHRISFNSEGSEHILYQRKRERLRLTYMAIDAGVDECTIRVNERWLTTVVSAFSNPRQAPEDQALRVTAAALPRFMLQRL